MTTCTGHTQTDWRGVPYDVGTNVLYARMSGRSCELSEGNVVDIWYTYWSSEAQKWKRWDPNDPNPDDMRSPKQIRVKIQPNGRGSRGFFRRDKAIRVDENGKYVRDESGEIIWDDVPIKPVTVLVTENITVIDPVKI